MSIPCESYGHAVILKPKGELTEDTLNSLQRAVDHQLENPEVVDIILNVEEVTFMDSMTLEYFLDLKDRLIDKFGCVRFVHCPDSVRKILEVTRLDTDFEIFEDITAAVKAMRV